MTGNNTTFVDFSSIEGEFTEYLKIADERIIFSGIFGIGKTTFLRDYFEKSENYSAIHLSPVNYHVASNKDIFELIRFDIFYELLDLPIEYEKVEFSDNLLLPYFIQNELMDMLASFLKSVPHIGKPSSNIIQSVVRFLNRFEGYKKEENKDELETVVSFLKSIKDTKGSIYESDFYTGLIKELLGQLKEKTGKENVLLIDDLERIDPDHIFRLLNVFGAHLDTLESANKFGFDKVVLVFDIENVKSIFHHRYGADTNFEGYLDKFYSRDIFFFDNRRLIEEQIKDVLERVKFRFVVSIR